MKLNGRMKIFRSRVRIHFGYPLRCGPATQPYEETGRGRCRVDGDTHEHNKFSHRWREPAISNKAQKPTGHEGYANPLGSIQPHGLTWDGTAYSNALYGQAAVRLDITVEGGMGKLTLEQSSNKFQTVGRSTRS
jgi:hypothetical protein